MDTKALVVTEDFTNCAEGSPPRTLADGHPLTFDYLKVEAADGSYQGDLGSVGLEGAGIYLGTGGINTTFTLNAPVSSITLQCYIGKYYDYPEVGLDVRVYGQSGFIDAIGINAGTAKQTRPVTIDGKGQMIERVDIRGWVLSAVNRFEQVIGRSGARRAVNEQKVEYFRNVQSGNLPWPEPPPSKRSRLRFGLWTPAVTEQSVPVPQERSLVFTHLTVEPLLDSAQHGGLRWWYGSVHGPNDPPAEDDTEGFIRMGGVFSTEQGATSTRFTLHEAAGKVAFNYSVANASFAADADPEYITVTYFDSHGGELHREHIGSFYAPDLPDRTGTLSYDSSGGNAVHSLKIEQKGRVGGRLFVYCFKMT